MKLTIEPTEPRLNYPTVSIEVVTNNLTIEQVFEELVVPALVAAGFGKSAVDDYLGECDAAESALLELYEAADVYAADQSSVTDERVGLVQPITAEDGRRLNEALVVAAKVLGL